MFSNPCIPIILGCTNTTAFNYNSLANVDDGSCIAPLSGCTDPDAANYYADANFDDGSCVYPGCTVVGADNYDATANVNDGSCEFTGCVVKPQFLTTTNVGTSTATLNWEASSPNMNGYFVRIRPVDGAWNTFVNYQLFGITTTSINITGLFSDTEYEWQIRAFCLTDTDLSGWTPIHQNQFTTNELPETDFATP